jgi:UDP-N-acetyl-D-mannosaminuronic acid transferase (WecB/TagA/CpsF family)
MAAPFRPILGIRFYIGEMAGLLELTSQGGLIVVPSAPVLAELPSNPANREALIGSDFAITDSGFMVLLWRLRHGQWLPRISGLKFLRALLNLEAFRRPGATFWIMPSVEDDAANRGWLHGQGLAIGPEAVYVAPRYPGGRLQDLALLARIERLQPKFVVINLAGGVQERLGLFLRDRLSYRPALICTGAAIAFLSGRQANIPPWADRLIVGWFLRILGNPAKFIPRYWKALRLVPLLLGSWNEP